MYCNVLVRKTPKHRHIVHISHTGPTKKGIHRIKTLPVCATGAFEHLSNYAVVASWT